MKKKLIFTLATLICIGIMLTGCGSSAESKLEGTWIIAQYPTEVAGELVLNGDGTGTDGTGDYMENLEYILDEENNRIIITEEDGDTWILKLVDFNSNIPKLQKTDDPFNFYLVKEEVHEAEHQRLMKENIKLLTSVDYWRNEESMLYIRFDYAGDLESEVLKYEGGSGWLLDKDNSTSTSWEMFDTNTVQVQIGALTGDTFIKLYILTDESGTSYLCDSNGKILFEKYEEQ
ncbi:MAG: hypothetical protein IKV45_05820 [Firmicutes bacterium]|nr:hypothetical protein [Bacillota bacterium]